VMKKFLHAGRIGFLAGNMPKDTPST